MWELGCPHALNPLHYLDLSSGLGGLTLVPAHLPRASSSPRSQIRAEKDALAKKLKAMESKILKVPSGGSGWGHAGLGGALQR